MWKGGSVTRSSVTPLLLLSIGASDVHVVDPLPVCPVVADPQVPDRQQRDLRAWAEQLDRARRSLGDEAVAAAVRLPTLEPVLDWVQRSGASRLDLLAVSTDQGESPFAHTDTVGLVGVVADLLPIIAARHGVTVGRCRSVSLVGPPHDAFAAYEHAGHVVADIASEVDGGQVISALVGGTPAMALGLTLRLLEAHDAGRLALQPLRVVGGVAVVDARAAVTQAAHKRTALRSLVESGRFADAAVVAEVIGGSARLCAVLRSAAALEDLDIEGCARVGAVDDEALAPLRFPATADAHPGALADLVPLVALVLEGLDRCAQRDDVLGVLSRAHLIADHLPLLAWHPLVGSSDPRALQPHVAASGSLWAGEECPGCRPFVVRKLAEDVVGGSFGADDWPNELSGSLSRVAGLLGRCGVRGRVRAEGLASPVAWCRQPCSVYDQWNEHERRGLSARCTSAGVFSASPLLQLRHRAPIAHSFAVPSSEQVLGAWSITVDALEAAVGSPNGLSGPLLRADSLVALGGGLAELVSFVAGREVHASTLVDELEAEALDLL